LLAQISKRQCGESEFSPASRSHACYSAFELHRPAQIADRLQYYRRVFAAYLFPATSQLKFWHDTPRANLNISVHELGEYYMAFDSKAAYSGPFDGQGIPMLDYRGRIGLQYNPIAIAQWGLGNYDLFHRNGSVHQREKFLKAADWLCSNLQPNTFGVPVWTHHFDWDYRDTLKAPWYSGLAQGQGISLLVRTHRETGNAAYLQAAERAFASLLLPVDRGGVQFADDEGDIWLEEYIVSPPTHILNGFIWAIWGAYDYYLATSDPRAHELFYRCAQTLVRNLDRYDLGYWSLYELSGTRLKMVASAFYHRLHIVQLRLMSRLTGVSLFARAAERWEAYTHSRSNQARALCCKSAFKLCYY
jgi:heparosan-N-sulfate-glucuronate 5-epimerase